MKRLVVAPVHGWNRFWFAPVPTSTLAVLRITYGLVCLAYAISLYPDLDDFFFSDGVLPAPPDPGGVPGILSIFSADSAVIAVFALLVAGSVCCLAGYHSRLATFGIFLALLAFNRRNIYVFNSGDVLLRIEGLLLAMAPSGAALSVDSRRAGHGIWHFPARSPWAVRLLQIQITMLYVTSVWAKVRGESWNEGSAVSYALRITDLTRFSLPESITTSLLLSNLATYATLLIEASLALLLWNSKARPFVLAAGVCLHLGIELTLLTGFFTPAVFVGYLAFIPEDAMARWLESLRRRWEKSALPILRRLRPPGRPRPVLKAQ